MNSREMMIDAPIMENKDTSNRIVKNEGERTVEELRILKVSEHGNKDK